MDDTTFVLAKVCRPRENIQLIAILGEFLAHIIRLCIVAGIVDIFSYVYVPRIFDRGHEFDVPGVKKTPTRVRLHADRLHASNPVVACILHTYPNPPYGKTQPGGLRAFFPLLVAAVVIFRRSIRRNWHRDHQLRPHHAWAWSITFCRICHCHEHVQIVQLLLCCSPIVLMGSLALEQQDEKRKK